MAGTPGTPGGETILVMGDKENGEENGLSGGKGPALGGTSNLDVLLLWTSMSAVGGSELNALLRTY